MRPADLKRLQAKFGKSESTTYKVVATPGFPEPKYLLPPPSKVRIWDEDEVDLWLAAGGVRRAPAKKHPGRVRFWADVREGRRLHPRTQGKLAREAREAEAAARKVANDAGAS